MPYPFENNFELVFVFDIQKSARRHIDRAKRIIKSEIAQ